MADPGGPEQAITVSLLGEIRVSAGDVTLAASALPRRAEVCLARLALDAGRGVSREALAGAVWGESWPESWRAALRNVVTELRRSLARAGLADVVLVEYASSGYRLRVPTGCTVDVILLREGVERAEHALREQDLAQAWAISRRLLPDCTAVAVPRERGDWMEALRLEIEDLRVRLERIAAQAALGLGYNADAERLARRGIASMPLHEDGHRALIAALRAGGNRAAALAAYDACRRLLVDELGAMPSPATQTLFLEILAEEREQAQVTPVAASGGVTGPLGRLARASPFVGRLELLGRLTARLGMVRGAGALAVCVSGEPGIGKTRLAAELAVRAHGSGAKVLYGRAEDWGGAPYGALLKALEEDITDHGRPPTLDPSHARRGVVQALRRRVGAGTALLVLDDMQWGSRAEFEVLDTMLGEPVPIPILVLVLHRAPADDAVTALGTGPRVEHLELPPLSQAEIAELIAVGVGGRPDAAWETETPRLWRLSGGNPLIAGELLRSSSPAVDGESPVGLGQLVRDRVAGLPTGGEEVLRAAAVAGLDFDPAIVAGASGVSDGEARQRLERAREAGLLIAARDPHRLEFRHGLLRDALLESVDRTERLRLHARVGAELEAGAGEDPARLVDLAHHFAAAAPLEWRRAVRYALPAARAAFAAGVYEDVVALAARALAALDDSGERDPDVRIDLEVLLGGAQRALGDPRGHETLSEAFESAAVREDSIRMADAALGFSHAGSLSDEMYLDDQLLDLYRRALDALGARDPGRRALLLGRVASGLSWRRGLRASGPSIAEALELASATGEESVTTAVLVTARRHLSCSADLAHRAELEDRLQESATASDDPGLRVSTALWRLSTNVLDGEGRALEGLLRDAASHVHALRMGSYHHSLAYEQASVALLRGRVAEADALVGRAVEVAVEWGLPSQLSQAIRLVQLLLVRFEQGRLAALRDEAAEFFLASGERAWAGMVAFIDAALGELGEVGGRIDLMLDEFVALGPRTVCPPGLIAFMAAPVVALGDEDRAHRLLELSLPYSGQGTYFAGFAGPVDYHLGLLDGLLGERAQARRHFAAGEALCRRLGAPRWRARCRFAMQLAPPRTARPGGR